MKDALDRTGAFMRGLAGWRRAAFAFAAGLVSSAGFAPLNFFPALLLGFAALVLLLDAAALSPRPLRGAALAGWIFAFGQYLVGFHWVGYAFLVDPAAHLWQMPFALLLLAGGLALYAGLACMLAVYFSRRLGKQGTPSRLFVFAVLYAACEWLRGHAFTGFPWNLPAYGWGASLEILQSTALFGAYGLSFLTILFGATLAELFCGPRNRLFPAAMAILFAGFWAGGAARLAATPTSDVPGVHLRLVQPDVPQREKEMARFAVRDWRRLLDLSRAPSAIAPTHIIWPEAASPFAIRGYALDEITLLTAHGSTLMTGAIRVSGTAKAFNWYNSLYLFGPGGKPLEVYDKSHLVPFGEYVPWPDLLNPLGIAQLIGLIPATPGDGLHRYAVPGAPPVTPLICYEDIFPGAVIAKDGRPGWFVNVTDDSWFGPWAGPPQHLLTARVRAIEEGIPVARAANTGISAVIDPAGRVIASLGLGRMGIVDSPLPASLRPTPYARFGDWGFLLLLILGAATALIPARK